MLRPPLPGTPPPVPRGRFSSLTVAARGLLRRHGWTLSAAKSLLRRTCNAGRRPLSRGRSQSSPQIPAREKRALRFRGKTPSSRDTSCSSSRPRPQRREIWRRKCTWALVSVYWDRCLRAAGFRCRSQRLGSSVVPGEPAHRGEPSFLTHRTVLG